MNTVSFQGGRGGEGVKREGRGVKRVGRELEGSRLEEKGGGKERGKEKGHC